MYTADPARIGCSSRSSLLAHRRAEFPAVSLEQAGRSRLPYTFLLMTVPAQRRHLVERRRNLVEVHVMQLKQFLLLVEQRQAGFASSPRASARDRR